MNSVSKTYSVTGWRVGWTICTNPDITNGIRRVHDFLTVGAAAPLQEAAVTALHVKRQYYADLATMYQRKRDRMLDILRQTRFRPIVPPAAYYIISDISEVAQDDVAFLQFLVKELRVATVPARRSVHH